MQFMELMATLGLDASNYNQGLDAAQSRVSAVGGAIMRGVGVIGAASAAAVGAAATGVVNLTRQAVNSYAEYEQMVGGIGKIFGTAGQSLDEYRASLGETDLSLEEIEQQYHSLEATQQLVLDNANNAWRTAGLGVNDYMSTVTTLSGALLGSLDNNSQLAAQYADRAIGDMSDIANTYGYTMDEVSQIYTSVSRGLYQTIDTLTAGQFAGTKSGYEELINTMASMTDIQERLNITVEEGNYDYDNFVNAMSVYNEYMGIAGTTTNEAMSTIQGSMAMLQSTWQNLITGLGDENADLGSLIDNVVTSAMAVVNNVSPIVEQALGGIASLIEQIAPVISEQLPTLIDTVLPSLLNAATTLVVAVADNLPDILSEITSRLPNIFNQVIPTIVGLVPSFIRVAGQIVSSISSALVDNADELIQAGLEVMQLLVDSFIDFSQGDGMDTLMETAFNILETLGNFLIENLPALMEAATRIIVGFIEFISAPENQEMILNLAFGIIQALADGLVLAMPLIANLIPQLISDNIQVAIAEFPRLIETIGTLITDLFLMIVEMVGGFMGLTQEEIMGRIEAVWDFLGPAFEIAIAMVVNTVTSVGELISGMWTSIGTFFTDGIVNVGDALSGWWDEIVSFFTDLANNAVTWASDMIDNFVDGLMGGISRVGDAVSGIADEVRSFLGFSEPERGPLSNFHTFAPDMIDLWNQTLEDSMSSMDTPLTNVSNHIADGIPTPMNAGGYTGGAADSRPIVIPVYIGNEKIDEIIVDSNQRMAFISGGRA